MAENHCMPDRSSLFPASRLFVSENSSARRSNISAHEISPMLVVEVKYEETRIVCSEYALPEAFQPVEIVESILGGFLHRGQEGLARIFLQQAQQLPQGKRHYFATLLLERRHVGCDLGRGLYEGLFFGMRVAALDAFPARRPMFSEGDALGRRSQDADMGGDVARVEFDLELVSGLAHFHGAADPGDRNRVANGVHRNISFHVDRAQMQAIDFGNPRRQWF